MAQPARMIAGAMSGTSADGVDVALVRIDGRGEAMTAQLVQHHFVSYAADVRQTFFRLREHGELMLSDLALFTRQIPLTYARAVNEAFNAANLRASDLSAIAAHGQTIYHAPPDTIQ